MLTISHTESDKDTIITANGSIDSTSADDLDSYFQQFFTNEKRRILFDMTEIRYISSAGLRVLLTAQKSLKPKGGEIVLCGINDNVKQVIELSGFHALFHFASSVVTA
ncbi:MAG: STAS domain-containing protein [Candidatus Kapabacteria bacterium]|nr:STAS domain-containing protein [Candidatus Kapabacteria bacterium]